MFAGMFGFLLVGMANEGGVNSSDNPITKYEAANQIITDMETVEEETDIAQDAGAVDIVGGYFLKGYSALKQSVLSFKLFTDVTSDASEDIIGFGYFQPYIVTIILILIIIGVVVTVLFKMRI